MTRGAMNYFSPQMRKRQWVIPNSAHLPDEAKPYRAEGRTMAAVGRLVPQKGFDRLLDAFSSIATYHTDCTLVIVGAGHDSATYEEQHLSRRIVTHGSGT